MVAVVQLPTMHFCMHGEASNGAALAPLLLAAGQASMHFRVSLQLVPLAPAVPNMSGPGLA